jgi:hypothetical protein
MVRVEREKIGELSRFVLRGEAVDGLGSIDGRQRETFY